MGAFLLVFADNGAIADIKDVTVCGECRFFCKSGVYDYCGLDSTMGVHGNIKVVSKTDACTKGAKRNA